MSDTSDAPRVPSGNPADPFPIVNAALNVNKHVEVYAKDPTEPNLLNFSYLGGRWQGFAVVKGTLALTDNAVNYITVNRASGVISASTSNVNWLDTDNHARVYKITTLAGAQVDEEDHRTGDGGIIGSSGGSTASSLNVLDEYFSGDGTQTDFVLPSAPGSLASLEVFVAGVHQRPGIDFTLSGLTIAFTSAPPSATNNIYARWIATAAVGTVADGAITFAKIQDISTNVLLGRDTPGTGPVEEIAIGSGLSLTGNVLSATGGGGGGGASGLRNKLFNATFFVNQRQYTSGAATAAANQYTLDRWRVVTSGQNLSWSDSGGVRTVTAPAGGIEQVIEGNNLVTGDYVISWGGTATCTVGGVAKANGDTVAVTGGSNLTIRFSGGTVVAPQFEKGTTPTDFEDRPFGLELALCQRYLLAYASEDTASGICFGYTFSSTQGDFMLPAPVELRAPPTSVVVSNVGHITAQYPAGIAVATGIALSGVSSRKSALVRLTFPTGFTVGQAAFIYFNNASGLMYFEGSEL